MVNIPDSLYQDIKNKTADTVGAIKHRIEAQTTPVSVEISATADGETALYIVSVLRDGEYEVVDVFTPDDLDDLDHVDDKDDLHNYARKKYL